MKKILFLLLGLMSLVGLSSCEDKFLYDSEKKFVPLKYEAKIFGLDEEAEISTTLLIKGVGDLVFDQIEKTDWSIITPADFLKKGSEPLVIHDKVISLTDDLMYVNTNYGRIPVTVGNTKVTYSYMGQDIELSPEGGLSLLIGIEVYEADDADDAADDEAEAEAEAEAKSMFLEHGDITFTLCVGLVPVQKHSLKFVIAGAEK